MDPQALAVLRRLCGLVLQAPPGMDVTTTLEEDIPEDAESPDGVPADNEPREFVWFDDAAPAETAPAADEIADPTPARQTTPEAKPADSGLVFGD